MKTMNFEPYQPISADVLGLLAAVGKSADDYAQTLHLAIELIFQSLKQQNFTGEVEFYSSTNDAQSRNCKIGMGFRNHNLPLTATDWPQWQKRFVDAIRKECQFCGAVQYLKGEPIAILEHRPVSQFIKRMAEYCDPSCYVYMDYPLGSGCLTETAFLELPDRAFLTQDLNCDGFEVAGEDTRLVQWLELPAKAKGNTWYVFRNRAHFDSFNSKTNCNHDEYPLKPTGHDPFYLNSSENLRRQREIFMSRQKASLAGGVKTGQ